MSFNFDVQAGTSVKFPVGGKYCDRDIVVNATGTLVSGEIAITENGTHDVARYATANVNVQSAPVLLWTNASPTSSFPQRTTVEVNGTGCTGYIIECRYSASNDKVGYGYFPMGATGSVIIPLTGGSLDGNERTISNTTEYSITFLYASGVYTNAIPTRIWGVKFTL